MSKERRYTKATRERLVELFERIGYKVTSQSTDGTYQLLRLPDGTSTEYWLMPDRIEHRLSDNRGGAYFGYSRCVFTCDDDTVSVISKDSNNTVFASFHNFQSHRDNPHNK